MTTGVDFEVGGRVRTLRYGLNALCNLEQQTGRKALEIFRSLDGDQMEIRVFRSVVQAGLSEKLTAEDVGDLIDEVGIQNMAEILGRAVRLAFPDATPGEVEAGA